ATWTVALLILRLRAPRPSARRLARQPGAMALASATLVAATCLVALGLAGVACSLMGGFEWSLAFFVDSAWGVRIYSLILIGLPGWGVAGAWLTLIVGGRWRPEPSWIDRAGRLAGVVWIALLLGPVLVWLLHNA